MNKLVPIPTHLPAPQIDAPKNRQSKDDDLLLLPTTDLPTWASVMVGGGLYLIAGVEVIFMSQGVSAWNIAWVLALYLLALVLFVLLRRLPLHHRWGLLGVAGLLLLGTILGCALFASLLSNVVFGVLIPLLVVYRFEWRWVLWLLGIATTLFVAVTLIPPAVFNHQSVPPFAVLGNLILIGGVTIIAASLRSRRAVIQKLRASEAQLRVEMEHTAELAAARERARIARDIHDVLAHSLTALSIQAQATRQVLAQQPELAGQMLDEMAAMLRESIVESRRVVGLLREATQAPGDTGPLGARLRALAERFAERTSMQCTLEEIGQARELNEAQEKTLHFAVQEALTNAYRHGSSQHVWMTLRWQASEVSLEARDDGTGQPALTFEGKGGQGLRGMRERAGALGGTLSAGPREDGGFAIRLTLPLQIVDANAAEGKG